MTTFFIEKFYLFFEGILLFQVAFFGMVYFIAKRKDVLYYALLNLFAAAYFFLNAPNTFLGIHENIVFNAPYYPYVNFAIFLSMIFLYPLFLKEIFNDTLEQYSYVKKVYILTQITIVLLYVLFVLFGWLGWEKNAIFYTGHLINGPFCTLILILNFRQQGYKKLVIYGMVFIFICVNITVALTMRYNAGNNSSILDKFPLAIIKIGMLIDILLFQVALLTRWNEQEKQLAVEKLQSMLAVEKLRNKISSELHDDIGSTLSGVSMYSHLSNNQMARGEHDKAEASMHIIQKSANEMVDKLNDLIWSVKPSQDTVQKLFERLKEYTQHMCRAKDILFTMHIPSELPRINLPDDHHYQLYLLLKEAVNNAVKYSEADLLSLNVDFDESVFKIEVKDNGKGFIPEKAKNGNGLKNMQKRSEEIGAEFSLASMAENGTSVSIKLKITQ